MAKAKSILDSALEKTSLVSPYKEVADLQKVDEISVLSTGIFALDMAFGDIDPVLGTGGLLSGRLAEFCGWTTSGKSIISDMMIRTTQQRFKKDRCTLGVYSEATSKERLEKVGIDLNRHLVLDCARPTENGNPVSAEEALSLIIDNFLADQELKLIVIDSVAALVTKDQLEKGIDESEAIATLAKLMNKFSHRFYQKNKANVTVVMINHYKEPISTGPMSLPPVRTRRGSTGGRTKEYLSEDRIFVSGKPLWTKENHPVENKKIQWGIGIDCEVFKNRTPNSTGCRPASFEFNFNTATINNEQTIINRAAFFGRKDGDKITSDLSVPVYQAGAWFYIGDAKLQGADNAIRYLKQHPEVSLQLQKELLLKSEEYFEGGLIKSERVLDQL